MSKEGQGISNCYIFKSRLQEYAQKVGFSTPVYETIKEGPSHEPFFKSTVIVNNARYDSLPGFSNRKAAEQSAAEVALIELANSADNKDCISLPVHELGLCKNLLQEYAQKMNYAMPTYVCKREDTAGRGHFSCTVEIGGITYIGAVARTKKEAEIKAARTALLAIQTSPSEMGENPKEETEYTVVPCKRKEPARKQDAVKTQKPKGGRFKKKFINKRCKVGDNNAIQAENGGAMNSNIGTEALAVPSKNGSLDVAIPQCQLLSTNEMMPPDQTLHVNESHKDTSALKGLLLLDVKMTNYQPISMNDTESRDGTSNANHVHEEVSAGHQFSDGIEIQTVSIDEMLPQDGTPTMNQIHGDISASESLLKLDVNMSDCQSISVNVTTNQDGMSIVNEVHDKASAGHQFGEGNEFQPLSMDETKP